MDEEKLENNGHEEITVVSGDGSELDISEVGNHLNLEDDHISKGPEKDKIVIPPSKK